MLTFKKLPNDRQKLAFNFLIRKPERSPMSQAGSQAGSGARHCAKRLVIKKPKFLVSNNNVPTYHWNLFQKPCFNRKCILQFINHHGNSYSLHFTKNGIDILINNKVNTILYSATHLHIWIYIYLYRNIYINTFNTHWYINPSLYK